MAKAGVSIPSDTEDAAKPKSKKLLIIIIAVLVLGGGGGAGWFFTRDSQPVEEVAVVAHVDPKFVALDPFTVNLQQEGGEKFLQVGITLKFTEPELEEKIKLHMPEIRSHVLLLLSSKHAADIIPAEGKNMLAHEIAVETSTILGLPPPPAFRPAADAAGTSAMPATSGVEIIAASAPAAAHTTPAAAPLAASAPAAEPAGKSAAHLDVLFTSFIIQ